MDQTAPIDIRLPADARGVAQQDTTKPAGLDLLQVTRPVEAKGHHDLARASNEPHSMGQFLSGLDRTAGPGPQQITAQFTRKENFSIQLNHQYLDSNLEIKTLEAKNPSYTVSKAPDGTRTLSNISGLSLNFSTFGINERLDVKDITIKKDGNGNTSFAMQVENPIPPQTQKVFNTPATVPLTFTVNDSGKLTLPKDSELFYSLSNQSGGTLPGMVLQDAMHDAGSVAEFIEKNPTWVNTIMRPFLDRYAKDLQVDRYSNVPGMPGAVDTTGKVIGKIVGADAATPPGKPPAPPMTRIQAPGDYHETMKIDGRDRTFTIHVPPGYDPKKPMPMAVINHGLSQTGESIESMLGANAVSDKEGFIAVYPDSVNWFGVKDLRTWDSGNGLVLPGQQAGDIHFMDNIISTAKAQLNVDPMRVYMIGHSNGGMLTYDAAAALSGELAGIGILNSAMSGHEPQPKEPLSLYNTHGTKDSIIPFEGLTDTPPLLRDIGVPVFQAAQYGTDYYKKLDGITAPYTVTTEGNQTISTASNPDNGTAVRQVTVEGADHVYHNMQEALTQAWTFLKDHPRTKAPNPKDDVIVEPDVAVGDLTTVKQLMADVRKRGTTGIEQDADNFFDAARTISDGSIHPSVLFDKINKSTKLPFNDPVSQFVQNTTAITKKQDQISIDRKVSANIPLDVGFGIGDLKTMEVGNVKFTLAKLNGYPELKDITGITLHAQVAGHNLQSKIEDITELPDGVNGVNGRIYRATMENPLPNWARTILFSPKQFNVDLKMDSNLTPIVVDQAMTQRQILGKNPWVNGIADEAQDVVNLKDRLNLSNTLTVGSDVGITAGATYLAYRLALRFGGTKAKIAATLAFAAAPMAIDFIRKELSP